MDKKGIAIFIGAVLGATWAIQGVLAFLPWTQSAGPLKTTFVLIAILMLPALAALLASIVGRDPDYPQLTLWPVPKYPALAMAVLAPVLFAVAYAATTLLGWTTPDWKIQGLMLSLARNQPVSLDPSFFLVAGFAITIFLGPTALAVACVGAEVGWRTYLLPKLLPLGRVRAHLIVGVCTALWVMPIVFSPFRTPARIPTQFLYLIGISVAVSAFLDELWLRRRHAGLTAVCAGCFVSQATGVWRYLFPNASLPFAGTLGVFSVLVWLAAAAFLYFLPVAGQSQPSKPNATESAAT